MAKIILTGELIIGDSMRDAVLAALPAHIKATCAEPGCLVFRVEEKIHGCFTVYEEFTNRAAFNAHQARTAKSAWGRLTKTAQRNYSIIDQ